MRIHGEADHVYFFDADEGCCKIGVGEPGPLTPEKSVKSLVVAVEDSIVFMAITMDDSTVQYRTVVNEKVGIEWLNRPEVQSGTEWKMWAAEAVARQAKLPLDFFPATQQKWIKDQRKVDKPATIIPTPATSVNCVTPTAVSSRPQPVDADAGGPPGLDLAPITPQAQRQSEEVVKQAITVKGAGDKFDAAGNRIITVVGNETLGVEIRMAGAVTVDDKRLVVEAVEFGEEQGLEVLYLRVQK